MPTGVNDEVLARYLIQVGIATPDQIRAAKITQKADAKDQAEAPLAEVLQQQGLLTPAMRGNIEKKLRAQEHGGFEQIGNFRLLKNLGQGDMGTVYLAEDLLANHKVALKVLSRKSVGDSVTLARFKREAKAAGTLKHPNIVSAYGTRDAEVREELGLYFYAMDYCDGESLDRILERHRLLPWYQAVRIAAHVACGLQYAHEHGIVHGNIKPGHIIIDPNGEVKILDIGNPGSPIDSGQSFKTRNANYIAPEQVQESGPIDGRADIYSLGATLFHVISGQTPYSAPTLDSIAMKHVTEPVPELRKIRAEVPDDVCHILRVMMAKDPGERYQDCATLLYELKLFDAGKPLPSKSLFKAAEARALRVARAENANKDVVNKRLASYSKISRRIAATVVCLLIVVFAVFWITSPSAWELENKDKIFALGNDADASLKAADWRMAYEKFHRIVVLAKESSTKDKKLLAEVERAKQEIARLSEKLADTDEAARQHDLEAAKLVEAERAKRAQLEQKLLDEKLKKEEDERRQHLLQEAQKAELARQVEEQKKAEQAKLDEEKAKEEMRLAQLRKKETEVVIEQPPQVIDKQRSALRAECKEPMGTALALLSQIEKSMSAESSYTQFVDSFQTNWPRVQRSLDIPELKTLIDGLKDKEATALRDHLSNAGEVLFKCQAEWRESKQSGKLDEFDRQSWLGRLDAEMEDARAALQKLK